MNESIQRITAHSTFSQTRLGRGAFAGIGIGVAVMTAAGSTRADDSAAAQALFDQGKKLATEHKFSEACPKFEESERLDPGLGTLLNLADCYEHEGKLATAWSKFLELAGTAKAAGQAHRAQIGHDRAAALAPRLSNLVINVPDSHQVTGLEVRRDGTVVGQAEWGAAIPADSGAHTISASAPGHLPWSDSVTVGGAGTSSTIMVPELAPAPVAAEPIASGGTTTTPTAPLPTFTPKENDSENHGLGTQKIVALSSVGVGVAGVAVGAVFGLFSLSKHNDANTACPNASCGTQNGHDLWNDAIQDGNISTVAFIVGGVGLAAGAVLWFTAKPAGASAQVGMGPGSVMVSGRF